MSHPNKSKSRRTAELNQAFKTVADYRQLLALATSLHMGEEIDRLERVLAEYETDLDEQVELAIEAGFAPEDFE